MKPCPKCGAQASASANFCASCRYAFHGRKPKGNDKGASPGEALGGCLTIAIFCGVLYSRFSTPAEDPKVAAAKAKAEEAQAAADNIKGFHCLSGWDGSNRSLVDQIKHALRDPDSFEHDETRITPVSNGKHMVTMRYRARNGFGGMNVSTAVATVDHDTCEATIISTGEE